MTLQRRERTLLHPHFFTRTLWTLSVACYVGFAVISLLIGGEAGGYVMIFLLAPLLAIPGLFGTESSTAWFITCKLMIGPLMYAGLGSFVGFGIDWVRRKIA